MTKAKYELDLEDYAFPGIRLYRGTWDDPKGTAPGDGITTFNTFRDAKRKLIENILDRRAHWDTQLELARSLRRDSAEVQR